MSGMSTRAEEVVAEQLNDAVLRGDLAAVERLVSQPAGRALVRANTDLGTEAIFFAAELGHVEILSCMMAAGADPNKSTSIGGRALHQAAFSGQAGAVRCLLAAGADVDPRTLELTTPLNGALAAALLGRMAEGTLPGSLALTQIEIGGHAGHLEVVKILLASGADVQVRTCYGGSPLYPGSAGRPCRCDAGASQGKRAGGLHLVPCTSAGCCLCLQ